MIRLAQKNHTTAFEFQLKHKEHSQKVIKKRDLFAIRSMDSCGVRYSKNYNISFGLQHFVHSFQLWTPCCVRGKSKA